MKTLGFKPSRDVRLESTAPIAGVLLGSCCDLGGSREQGELVEHGHRHRHCHPQFLGYLSVPTFSLCAPYSNIKLTKNLGNGIVISIWDFDFEDEGREELRE